MQYKVNKNCSICLYNGVCEGRKDNAMILDCCIPEAPLRALQRDAMTFESFVQITEQYVTGHKMASEYWRSKKK